MRRFTSSRSHETTSGRAVFSEGDAARPITASRPPVKVIEIIRTPPKRSESACRRSLQPLSPIQNNSDLAQGVQGYFGG
jgi:hypothetical protein